jgi:5-methylcytosine-specific restriction enzyme subunit McrC
MRYAGALALAQLILRSTSISTVLGQTPSVAFVFDMNTVFEDFLSSALKTCLERHGGRTALQHGREHLDEEKRIKLIPDITWWKGTECCAVLDAKYKPLDDARFPNADAYQMLAYCTSLRLGRGYLVYAKDAIGKERTHHVRNSGPRIEVRSVDVEREPTHVLDEVQRLADEVAFARRGAVPDHGQYQLS